MEFDWLDSPFDLHAITPKEIEESFEDPFCLRLLPEAADDATETRYFNLGVSLGNRGIFSVFWTDGKEGRVIFARGMTQGERAFYERKNSELAG